MAKFYFYSVELSYSENREEKTLDKSFKNHDYQISRKEAFTYAKELFTLYEDEFINKESLLPIKLTINFNVGTRESEMESSINIDLNRMEVIPIYNVFFKKFEELTQSIKREMEIIKPLVHGLEKLQIYDFGKFIAEQSGEIDFISSVRNSLSKIIPELYNDQKSIFQIINCTRCGKKMEVERNVATLFTTKLNQGQKVTLSCTSCINSFFSDSKYNFYFQEIFDKNGISVLEGKRNLI